MAAGVPLIADERLNGQDMKTKKTVSFFRHRSIVCLLLHLICHLKAHIK